MVPGNIIYGIYDIFRSNCEVQWFVRRICDTRKDIASVHGMVNDGLAD